ncbi:hypothetical protein AGABI1DRAFT_108178 [Agaricus bisporus var. burnettii JB137-S8]|uniref:Uncharacterized protein n=1 Tax=Agaricus bisporus var. burnettii (strain JB137-S8 / ATCC MYA-4627 / FGSC 10392) TaxID=597362 RepID=K5X2E6_AGABU|nr:uncharacterized protein AGABI1DRAFT_108178 [Agaricus bisporus var. burnettii JB137-S8]EKM77328.1 hypothetical protein AGABI1DRAFT_108178 [Agaricus bisporus var. burnettii JB137-S8]
MERLTTEMVDLGHVAVSVCQEESRNHWNYLRTPWGGTTRRILVLEVPNSTSFQSFRSVKAKESPAKTPRPEGKRIEFHTTNTLILQRSGHHQSNLRNYAPNLGRSLPSRRYHLKEHKAMVVAFLILDQETPNLTQLHRELEGNLSNPSENNDEVTFAHLIRRSLRGDEK